MKINQYGETILSEDDLCNLVMQGHDITKMKIIVDPAVDIETVVRIIEEPDNLIVWTFPHDSDIAVPDWDYMQQRNWHMPQEYKDLDIAEYVLSLCHNEAQLQRCGAELLKYQERELFDLLRYLKYLVDVMKENHVIWGVGRGSSVASYVLYLLGVHRIDSLYYDLDPEEFLR